MGTAPGEDRTGDEHAEPQHDGRHRRAPAAGRRGRPRGGRSRNGRETGWRSLKRPDELGHRGEPVRGGLREGPLDRQVDALRHVGPPRPHARDRLREPLRDDRPRGRARERRLASQHLVQDAAERVYVGAGVDRLVPARLLRAHVGRGARARSRLGQVLVGPQDPRDAEVGDQRAAVLGEQQVFGLDVTVDHALLMGVIQRQRRLAGDPKGLVHGELPLPPQPVPERLALDVRHGEPEVPGGFP